MALLVAISCSFTDLLIPSCVVNKDFCITNNKIQL